MAKNIDFAKISGSYRHYRSLYELTQKFDRPSNFLLSITAIYLLKIFYFFRGHKLMAFLFAPITLVDKEYFLAFVFSKNHMAILRSLRFNGITIKSVHIGNRTRERDDDLYVSNRRLFVEALKVSQTPNILHKSLEDPIMAKNFVRVFKLIGCWNLYNDLLDQTKCVVNFNDHTPYSVVLQETAKEKGLKTVYIQHASVSFKFPPLYHDYNILFSQDSVNKYKNELEVKTYTLFDTRFSMVDPKDFKNDGLDKKVLVCTNMLDDPEKVRNLTEPLISLGYDVTIRPHPADNRKIWAQLNAHKSEHTSIWQDIGNSGIVIANESSVVLEAIYLDRKVYKAAFFSNPFDNYSYLAQKLLLNQHFSAKTLVDAIQEEKVEFDKQKLTYFVGNLDNCRDRLHDIIDDIKYDKDKEV